MGILVGFLTSSVHELDEAYLAFESAPIQEKPVVQHSYSQAASVCFLYKSIISKPVVMQ